MNRECKNCCAAFEPHQYNQKRCIDCLKKDKRFKEDRLYCVCKGCGEDFKRMSPQQFYCTQKCSDENRFLLNTYGITSKDYWKMYNNQNGVCSICKEPGFSMHKTVKLGTLVVDHCHATGSIRGLLCHNCNRALGLLKDRRDVLLNAVKYLKGRATTIVKTSTPKQVEAQGKGKWKKP